MNIPKEKYLTSSINQTRKSHILFPHNIGNTNRNSDLYNNAIRAQSTALAYYIIIGVSQRPATTPTKLRKPATSSQQIFVAAALAHNGGNRFRLMQFNN